MNIVTELQVPAPPSDNLGFYEHTVPTCVLSNPDNAQSADIKLGLYSEVEWASDSADSKLSNASSWGTKTLPGAGTFYFANHEDGNPTMGHLEPAQHDD